MPYDAQRRAAMPPRTQVLDYANTELIIGLVSPVGTNLSAIQQSLFDHFRKFEYAVNPIKLSSFLERVSPATLGVVLRNKPEYERIKTRMDAGNALRERTGRGDYLALHAANEIAQTRRYGPGGREPRPRTVHLLDSLKNPDEVAVLRKIYGSGFFLLGVYSPEVDRCDYLQAHKGIPLAQARRLITRDRAETSKLGQQTRDTFHLADAFISVGDDGSRQLWRFIDLIFGHPFHTPTRDENAMFLAYAASLRSADLSRQVGAVVVSATEEVIATGANDVPRFGGGLYGPEPSEDDQRDFKKGFDSNRQQIREVAEDTIRRVLGSSYTQEMEQTLVEKLKPGRLYDLTEFGRAVHAEMEALTACARIGVSPRGGTLYTTTFPCHNCAKHIVDAGISRVVYVEPYPKSQALALHADSMLLEERDGDQKSEPSHPVLQRKVRLTPFIGIGPRRYVELFSMRLGGGEPKIRQKNGLAVTWDPRRASPRVGMSPASYLVREGLAASELVGIGKPIAAGERRSNGRKKT
jgi:deoxycytidylate deaminase